jgi:hypothetical protein
VIEGANEVLASGRVDGCLACSNEYQTVSSFQAPPMLLSTIASSVVGTCKKGMPRMKVAAKYPARSPTTPPPIAEADTMRIVRYCGKIPRMHESLVQPSANIQSSSCSFICLVLEDSPGGIAEADRQKPWRLCLKLSPL